VHIVSTQLPLCQREFSSSFGSVKDNLSLKVLGAYSISYGYNNVYVGQISCWTGSMNTIGTSILIIEISYHGRAQHQPGIMHWAPEHQYPPYQTQTGQHSLLCSPYFSLFTEKPGPSTPYIHTVSSILFTLKMEMEVPLNCSYLSTKLHCISFQKTVILIIS
jgi:hypothetical protein